MEERLKALQEKMLGFQKNDVLAVSILSTYFNNLGGTSDVLRDSAYEFLNGFLWSMYCAGLIDKCQRCEMISELIELSV